MLLAEKTKPTSASNRSIPPISPTQQGVLQRIADDMVERAGYVAAMVATVEQGDVLAARAYAVDVPAERWRWLQERIGVDPVGPEAVIRLHDRRHRHNLIAQSLGAGNGRSATPVTTDRLYDVLRPIVGKAVAALVQEALGIRAIISLPFFLEDELVGNMIAASERPFNDQDIAFLTTLGNQAAAAIHGQRQVAAFEALTGILLKMQSQITDETEMLQTIVDAVVHRLDYAGAMVATLEQGRALPVRAYAVDIAPGLLRSLEEQAGISFVSSRSVVYLDREPDQQNLSVRAMTGQNGRPYPYLVSDELYDLFRPVVNRSFSRIAQRLTGIRQVLAIPFFLGNEPVGNLFVATRRPRFSRREIDIFITFGQQAAVGIRNARLYRIAEERRQISQMFGRMAFSASASLHALRNHVGAARTYLAMLEMELHAPNGCSAELLTLIPGVHEQLLRGTEILDSLHQPWQLMAEQPVDVNQCLQWALRKLYPERNWLRDERLVQTPDGLTVRLELDRKIPTVLTVADMLTEAFKIIIKNAVEALSDRDAPALCLQTSTGDSGGIEIVVRDNGQGIREENLGRIFELGWSTKKGQGMGFGLFWTKDFVEGLGGSIAVTSVWGEGTTFTVRLPCRQPHGVNSR